MFVCFKRKSALAVLAASLLVLAAPAWATQILVYSQAPNFQGLYASQNDTAGFGAFATTYDNFSLSSAGTITQVDWTGGYFNPQSLGSISGWTVAFYDNNNAGQPGSLISSFAVSNSEVFLQFDNIGDPVYSYTSTVNFAAASGTTYWLSVVPDLAFPPQWGWTSSSQGDGVSYQDYFGSRSANTTDMAFSLYTTQNVGVPEPGSLMLLGTGVIGLAGMIRRKIGG